MHLKKFSVSTEILHIMYSSVIRKIWEWSTTRLLAGGWDSRKSPSNPQISFALEPLERRVLLSAGLPLATFDSPPSNFDNQYEVVDEANILIDINNSNQSIFIPGNDCDSQDTQTDTDRQTLLTINEDFNDIAMESYLYDNAFPDDIAEVTRRELVFIDTNVPDYQRLAEDILACNDDTRDVVVVFLDSDRDGVEQISEALAGYEYLDAVHFISHGAEGSVKLGNTWLNADNMQGYAGAIAGWNDALAGDADMLFYGCDLAAGSEGQDLLSTLSKLTGADVAASEDPTGHALLGGDWELEYRIGAVEAANPFSQGFLANWVSVLAVPSSNGQDNSYEWITNVTFAGIDNTTAKESGGYGDYTSEVASIEQCASSNLSVTISPDSNDYIKAWVDWNQDDDFDDAGESFTVASNVSTSGPHTVSISAPGNAVVGTTVMRVSLRYNAAPPSTGSFDYGEVEDYSVTVTAAPSDPPTAVADSYELTEDSTLSAGGGTTFTEYIIDDTADGAHEIEPVDLDDDGDIDLIGTMYRDNKVVWYENDGNENFTENEIDASFVQASSSVTIDLDEDGDLDILVTGEGEDDIYWFENDGSESFTKNTITPSLGGAGGLQIGDVNGDNNLDIVACGG